jgi:DNA polymerase-1
MGFRLNKILAVDGSFALHRCLHVPEVFELKNSNGVRTGGIFGVLRMLLSEMRLNSGYFPIVCFDEGLSERRVATDPEYKSNRNKPIDYSVLTPEEIENDYVTQYRKQRNMLIELLMYFGVPCLKLPKVEGDDILYILSKMSDECLVLTDDRDMLQLITEKCRVRRPMNNEMWDLKGFLEDYKIQDVKDFVFIKAISGDGSDNIPSACKGVGKAMAPGLVKIIQNSVGSVSIRDWDDCSSFPTDECGLKPLCERNEVKYKKAYCNFDPKRFRKNYHPLSCHVLEHVLNFILNTN